MKALQSELARQALADPAAREQLRSFSQSPMAAGTARPGPRVEVRIAGRTVTFQPTVVPKAA